MIQEHKSYIYTKNVIDKKINAPKYVIKQCKDFIKIADGYDEKYIINIDKVELIDGLLKLMIMPTGDRAGQTLYQSLSGHQWLFIIAIFCVVYRDDRNKRRYNTGILEIGRRQGKTLIIAIIFIIMLLIFPQYSNMYSVAPISRQSKEVKTAIEQIIKSSPYITGKFKIRRDYIKCILNDNTYLFLTEHGNEDKFDSMTVSMFLADEVSNLKQSKTIEGLKSGCLTVSNSLACLISTKYNKFNNPFEEELKYAKSILDGEIEDSKVFALLYEPDDIENWITNDDIILQVNPLAQELPDMLEKLKAKRQEAILKESARENFITKHCNIIYQGQTTESYISHNDLIKCRNKKPIDWTGREVYLAMDLSVSNDNTAVAMVANDNGKIISKVMCFIPKGQIEEKNKIERLNYNDFIRNNECIACGDRIIDYSVIEKYVLSIEKTYNVKVKSIGFDRWNAVSSAQKLENEGYTVVEIKQHSSVLHPATKYLKECVLNQEFVYEENKLFEINIQNARCSEDTNLNKYVNKKKSNGKVDMVVALINAVYLLYQDILDNKEMAFICYT